MFLCRPLVAGTTKEAMPKTLVPSNSGLNRRQFIYYSAALASSASIMRALAAGVPKARILGSGEKLRIASVGGGGKGESDIGHCSTEEIVAIADVDKSKAAQSLQRHPNAKFYSDWRQMLDKEGKNIDAVTVSTPDHCHAIVASAAIKLGKHVYCQKPLTQTVFEARYLGKIAKEYGVVTQMGNQGSSEDGLRRAVEVVHSGLIGNVKQIHVWSNPPIWPQGIRQPASSDPVPEGFEWDIWLGPAKPRPFKKDVYHPFNWRGWLNG